MHLRGPLHPGGSRSLLRILSGVRGLLVLVTATIFLDAMLFGTLTPLVPGYAETFELSKVSAGLLVAAFGIGSLLGGVPGALVSTRLGPKQAVVAGMVGLCVSSIGFALAGTAWALGVARFVQGIASTTTWTGALAWITLETPAERRGRRLGTAFAFAVLGAILGPMLGAVARLVGIRWGFAAVGAVTLGLALAAAAHSRARPQEQATSTLRHALADPPFVTGLWLNALPAFFFGTLNLLAPLALAEHGFGAFAIAGVFLVAGLVETGANPVLGRISDSHGRLLPIRLALVGAVVVGCLLAATRQPWPLAALVVVAAISFGGFYTPGMALVADRAEATGVAQGLAFGAMNSAWALGQALGPSIGGALADGFGDAAPYLLCSALCAATLVALRAQARTVQAT